MHGVPPIWPRAGPPLLGVAMARVLLLLLVSLLQNTNVTKLEVGPQNLIIQDNHKLVDGPNPFVRIPPGYYCVVQDPIDQRLVVAFTIARGSGR